jgi:hypothetical protein
MVALCHEMPLIYYSPVIGKLKKDFNQVSDKF